MSQGAKARSPKNQKTQSAKRSARRGGPSPAVRKAFRTAQPDYETKLVLGRQNYLLLGIGMAAITIGFVLLSLREISISTILIVSGYCILIPVGLLFRKSSGPAEAPSKRAGDVGE